MPEVIAVWDGFVSRVEGRGREVPGGSPEEPAAEKSAKS